MPFYSIDVLAVRSSGLPESVSFPLKAVTKRKTPRNATCIDHGAVSGSRVPRPSAMGHLPTSSPWPRRRRWRHAALTLFYSHRSPTTRTEFSRVRDWPAYCRVTTSASPNVTSPPSRPSRSCYSSLGACNLARATKPT